VFDDGAVSVYDIDQRQALVKTIHYRDRIRRLPGLEHHDGQSSLHTLSFGPVPNGFPYSAPSHGVSLSPDEK